MPNDAPQVPPRPASLDLLQPLPAVHAEVFVAPSGEGRRLARALPWLVAPPQSRPGWFARLFGTLVVAPFTQMTFFSFELQAFLYEVFHTSLRARVGHFVLMAAVNFALMVGFAQVQLGPHPLAHGDVLFGWNGATAYAALLLFWYAALAAQVRMWAWFAVVAPVVATLLVAATWTYHQTFQLDAAARTFWAPAPTWANPWLWTLGAAAGISLSHSGEPMLAPRASGNMRWVGTRAFFFGRPGARLGLGVTLRRALRGLALVTAGMFDELWASPRLLPYGFLMLMFRAGYQPERAAQLDDWVQRATASGNPALDYVGVGGGTYLDPRKL